MTFTNQVALTRLTTSVIFLALLFCSASASAQARYSVTDIGVVGGPDDRQGAMALNDRGQIVGGNGHAFLWTDGNMRDLGALPPSGDPMDGSDGVAYGINNLGMIVGCSGGFNAVFGTGLANERAWTAGNGGLRELTEHPGLMIPYAINDSSQIAGVDQFRGFFFSRNVLITLGTFSHVLNGNRSTARGLNQKGQVVGWSTYGTHGQVIGLATVGDKPVEQFGPPPCHAFLWEREGKSGRMRDLGTLPGWVNSYAYGINNRAEIAGSVSDASSTNGVYSNSHAGAFLWRKGKMVSLGTLPGSKNSEAFGINDSTEIVGTSDARAFLWQQGKMLDLNACLPSGSGWTLEEARAINNKGQIIGSGKLNGQEHMFLLTLAVPASRASEAQTSAIRVHISSVLDQIHTLNYLRGAIAAASGYELVEQVCLDKPEVQYLLAHPAEAVPAMLKRLDKPTGIHWYQTRIVYFVVFRHAQDTRVLPALARYLDAVPDAENVIAPGSPFHYAVAALRTLAPSTLPADAPGTLPASTDLRVVLRERHQIAAKVRSLAAAPKQNKRDTRAVVLP